MHVDSEQSVPKSSLQGKKKKIYKTFANTCLAPYINKGMKKVCRVSCQSLDLIPIFPAP